MSGALPSVHASPRAGMAIAEQRIARAGRPASQGASNMDRIKLFGMLAGAAAAALTASPVCAQTDVKFALDWKFEGPAAPYFVAIDKGYYKAEGLNVTVDSGPGSVAGIARVAAGTYPIGFFDINSLVKFRDQNPDKRVQAVLMMYDKPAFAVGTTAKTGIAKPKDLEGRVLGAPAADGAFAQWKAFVKANGFGGVDMARLAKSIDQIGLTYEFKNRPTAEDIFTSQYLPPAAERRL